MIAVHILVSGRVQGVSFRVNAQKQANRLGLDGWVRNIPNGSVEIHAEGPDASVEEFIEWCRVGPSKSFVKDVKVKMVSVEGGPRGFYKF